MIVLGEGYVPTLDFLASFARISKHLNIYSRIPEKINVYD